MNWQLSFFWNADNVYFFFASRYIMGMVRYVVLYSLNVIYSYLIAAAAKSVIKPPQTSGKQLLVFSKKSWCGSALFVIVRFKILNTEWGDSILENILKLLMVLEFWMENGEILSCGEDAWSIQSLKQREKSFALTATVLSFSWTQKLFDLGFFSLQPFVWKHFPSASLTRIFLEKLCKLLKSLGEKKNKIQFQICEKVFSPQTNSEHFASPSVIKWVCVFPAGTKAALCQWCRWVAEGGCSFPENGVGITAPHGKKKKKL